MKWVILTKVKTYFNKLVLKTVVRIKSTCLKGSYKWFRLRPVCSRRHKYTITVTQAANSPISNKLKLVRPMLFDQYVKESV